MKHHPRSPLRSRRTACARFGLGAALTLALCGSSQGGENSAHAEVSTRDLGWGQALELILTAQGEGIDDPDLSTLAADFEVLDRRIERRFSVHNGVRNAQVRLGLILRPKRDGALTVPSIAFGGARTDPIAVQVALRRAEPSAALAQPPSDTGWGPSDPSPFVLPSPPWPEATPVPPIDLSPGTSTEPPGARPARESQRVASEGLSRNPWFWISLGLGAILAGLVAARRRIGVLRPGDRGSDQLAPPESPLDVALAQVRSAYEASDASAAREALLAWARLRWPADPPGNLTRFAQRCPAPLREHVRSLEMAFFSPEPIRWEKEPVPQELAKLTQADATSPVAPVG